MAKRTYQDSWGRLKDTEMVSNYQEFQEQINNLNSSYSEARLQNWQDEMSQLQGFWEDMVQEWQGTLDSMESTAGEKFAQIADQAVDTGQTVSQSLQEVVQDLSENLDDLGASLVNNLKQAWGSWLNSMGSNWSLAGNLGSMGVSPGLGWFHQGGIVKAHQGMVVQPSYLAGINNHLEDDEKLIVAQTGEGILPRDSMARLGQENFEALRSGQFERTAPSKTTAGHNYKIQVQVQALDGDSVAGLNWDRIVSRQIMPALKRAESRRV